MDDSTVQLAYGSWVPAKLVYVPAALGLLFAGLALRVPALAAVAVIFFACSLYFAYARHMFSPRGADIQPKVMALLVERTSGWSGTGKVLDIGCGSGRLSIAIAKLHPQAQVTGIDNWGNAWEYSQETCYKNARSEGVAGRVTFERASASALPFDDETFDLVMSNLVFHEVRGATDKHALVKEALRVVKRGGTFAFQDLFLWRQVYGPADELVAAVKSWGTETVDLTDSSRASFIPGALKLPFMLGTLGILHGKK